MLPFLSIAYSPWPFSIGKYGRLSDTLRPLICHRLCITQYTWRLCKGEDTRLYGVVITTKFIIQHSHKITLITYKCTYFRVQADMGWLALKYNYTFQMGGAYGFCRKWWRWWTPNYLRICKQYKNSAVKYAYRTVVLF